MTVECDIMDQQMVAEEEGEVAIEDEEPPVSKKKKGPISKLIGDLFEESNLTLPVGKVSKEIELYKAKQPVKDLDSDPLTWWQTRESVYLLMCKLVKAVHYFVATSFPSERLFSSSGNVITIIAIGVT